ncbi:MAG: DUF983 domain-containing protein [Acidimicrobiales bacterium]
MPPPTEPTPPGKGAMVWRGLVHRCPVCGSGHLFRHWFTMAPRCPRCSLRFRREEGSMTGDIGINTIVCFGALLVTMLAFFLFTWPELPVTAMVVTCVAVTIALPVLFYPSSKTLWLAFDLMFNPLKPGEVAPGFGPQIEDEAPATGPGAGRSTNGRNGSSNGSSYGSGNGSGNRSGVRADGGEGGPPTGPGGSGPAADPRSID